MKRVNPLFAVVFGALLLIGCQGQQFGAREKGALGGAAIGAGLGAIVGNQVGSSGAGIAIGSAIGAISGGLIGTGIDAGDARANELDQRLSTQEAEIEENRRLLAELKRRGTDARVTSRGVVVNLPDVLFEFDRADLTPEARSTAAEISRVLQSADSNRRISVEGHTDSLGTVAYNQRLSEDRARSVARELQQAGVPRSALSVRGLGESSPIASNKDERGRSRNRRVEVILENVRR